ncbi:hypothetical protein OIDMADRAFT_31814 [Oidiodendron maius Zn]|uniref:Uncharacterized protein n=1 Tax=Oidiodendron maius (strain Zn) TaxID=913774 RepID=A0A0C3H603_OIDMZ|nr:hypothetical protein OIDMADRAFT_31814 [Oidiodendron maius Zn]
MSAKKSVRFQFSVDERGDQLPDNVVTHQAALKTKTQRRSSSNYPAVNTGPLLSQRQPGSSLPRQLTSGGLSTVHGQRYPSHASATVHIGTPTAKRQPGWSDSDLKMKLKAPVQVANRSPSRMGNMPRANTSARRSQGSPSQLTPRSKRAVPPAVPDPPPSGVLTPPPTPRPKRLSTPTLTPIDPSAYYPSLNLGLVNSTAVLPPSNPVMEHMQARKQRELH